MAQIEQFTQKKYMNLETFRKNGIGVRTPVWFAQDGGMLYVITMADSGKVKRIRRDGHVNVAPCKFDGRITGPWMSARARELTDPEVCQKANRLLDRKYGLLKKLFERQRKKSASRDTYLEIVLERQP